MKRCENCRVLLPDNQKNCPLCHRSLPGGPEETVLPNPDFPAYPQVQLKKFRAVFFASPGSSPRRRGSSPCSSTG